MSIPQLIPIAQGVHADILLAPGASHPDDRPPTDIVDATSRLIVLKLVVAQKNGVSQARRPHDVVREVRTLEKGRHDNVVPLLAYEFRESALEHILTFPLLALTLMDVLAKQEQAAIDLFIHTASGVFAALAHLHALGIGHRDVNPNNIMFDWKGKVRLIDFGTAWNGNARGDDGRGGMSCAVGVGPYRAPELLFSPSTYDSHALDLWSAGASLAEFFRPRARLRPSSVSPIGSTSSSVTSSPKQITVDLPLDSTEPAEMPDMTALSLGQPTYPPAPLFSAQFGELGLAASIFRLLGTPTPESWPTFARLPDALKMPFDPKPPRALRDALETDTLIPAADERAAVLDVLESLVRLEPGSRRSAAETLACMGGTLSRRCAVVEEALRPLLVASAERYRG